MKSQPIVLMNGCNVIVKEVSQIEHEHIKIVTSHGLHFFGPAEYREVRVDQYGIQIFIIQTGGFDND